jgi:hypothetical protein
MNTKYWIYLAITALITGFAFFAVKSCESQKPEIIVQRIDSVLKVFVHDTTFVEGKGKVIWKTLIDTNYIFIKDSMLFARFFKGENVVWDSIPITETNQYILSKPFASCLDTICKKDTIKACYEFPTNYLSVLYKPHPDSIYEKTIYVLIKKHWYFGAGIHVGAGYSGSFQGSAGLSIQLGYKIAEW